MRVRAPRACVLVLLLMAPALVHAQLGGLLTKQAGEALKGKPPAPPPTESTTPAGPAPAPKPVPSTASKSEQLAWDQYNLRTVLKKQLTAFVALVPTADYAAVTKEEDGRVRFVNPASERKGQVWKACFRAGKRVSTRAMETAQAWLKEL